MKLKLKITQQQAAKILYSIPNGRSITLTAHDAAKIIGKKNERKQ